MQFHPFSDFDVNPQLLHPPEKETRYQLYMNLGTGLDGCGKSSSFPDLELRTVLPLAIRCAAWATPAACRNFDTAYCDRWLPPCCRNLFSPSLFYTRQIKALYFNEPSVPICLTTRCHTSEDRDMRDYLLLLFTLL